MPPAGAAGEEPGATAIAPPGGLVRAFAAMPIDYELVIAIDAGQLRASALYRTYEPRLREALGDDLVRLRSECGFDPLSTATGLLIGARGVPETEHATVFVSGLDRQATTACLGRRIAARRADHPAARLIVDGDFVDYAEDDPEDGLRLRWLGRRTALVVIDGDDAAGPRALAVAAAARDGAGLTRSPAFMDLAARTRTGAAVWFIARGELLARGPPLSRFRAIRGAFDAGDGVTGEVRLTAAGVDAARTIAADLDRELTQVKQALFGSLASDVTVRADGDDVVVAIALSAAQLEGLLTLSGLLRRP